MSVSPRGTDDASGPRRNPFAANAVWAALGALNAWRRFIFLNFLAITAVVVVVILLLPRWYAATASILPPKDPNALDGSESAASSLNGLLPGALQRESRNTTGAYNYLAILHSRSAMEGVVRAFDLFRVYGISDSSMEKAVRELSRNVSFEEQDGGNILVRVYDRDPRRASAMASSFIDRLNDISRELGTRESHDKREFIGERIERSRRDLRAAEDSLRDYQVRSGTMIVPSRGRSSDDPIADLYSLKAIKEIQLAVLRRTSTEDQPSRREIEIQIAELDARIGKYPGSITASRRLYRAITTQERIIDALFPLYEQALLDEQKNVPAILVLDAPVTSERAVKPRRMLIVCLASSVTLQMLLVAALIMHGMIRRVPVTGAEQWARGAAARMARLYRVNPVL